MLHLAYAPEMQTSFFFQGHEVEINDSLMELGTNPTDDSASGGRKGGSKNSTQKSIFYSEELLRGHLGSAEHDNFCMAIK
jgi:hypothetical protein